jgi:hypothetical protein
MSKDSGAVDAGILAVLEGDAALLALLPDGVFLGRAYQDATAYAVLEVIGHEDEYQFGGSAFERFHYAISATTLATDATTASQAAARIDALLDDARPTIAGYKVVELRRSGYLNPGGVDDPENTSVRWTVRGGYYRVIVQPAA